MNDPRTLPEHVVVWPVFVVGPKLFLWPLPPRLRLNVEELACEADFEVYEVFESEEDGTRLGKVVVVDRRLRPVHAVVDMHDGEGVELVRLGNQPLPQWAVDLLDEAGLRPSE